MSDNLKYLRKLLADTAGEWMSKWWDANIGVSA